MEKFAFTEKRIRDLPFAADGRVEYADAEVDGLQLRVGTEAKSFFVRARPSGGRVERVTIGRFPKVSVEAARLRARTILGELADGKSRRQRDRAARETMTFRQVADHYFADIESRGARTVDDLRQVFERYLGKLPDGEAKKRGRTRSKPPGSVDWERRMPSEIDPDDVKAMVAGVATGSGKTTANRVQQLFRAIVNHARKNSMIARDHAGALVDAVSLFRENSRTRRLSADEVRTFFQALDAEAEGAFRDYIRLLLFTGARSSNVAAMRWDELDVDARTWEIPGNKAKASEPIIVPLGPTPLEIVKARKDAALPGAEYVFPAFSASGHMVAPKKTWAAFRVRAGLKDLRMHDIRRTLGSFMLDEGAPLEIIGKQLGHRDAKSTAVYARLALHPVRAAQERAERAILEAAAKRPEPEPSNVVAMPTKKRRKS
jgi:integrase